MDIIFATTVTVTTVAKLYSVIIIKLSWRDIVYRQKKSHSRSYSGTKKWLSNTKVTICHFRKYSISFRFVFLIFPNFLTSS